MDIQNDNPDSVYPESENLATFSTGWWQYSKELCRAFGGTHSLWLTALLDHRKELIEKKKLRPCHAFHCDQSKIEQRTRISPLTQTTIIKQFSELNIISAVRQGVPPRNYYSINLQLLVDLTIAINNKDEEIEQETGKKSFITKTMKNMDLKTLFAWLYYNNKTIENKTIVLPKGNTAPAVHKNSVSSIKDTATATPPDSTTATPVKLKRRTATATIQPSNTQSGLVTL